MKNYSNIKHNGENIYSDRLQYDRWGLKCENHIYIRLNEYGGSEVCVCLSARISPEPQVRSLPNFLCMMAMAVARSSSIRRVTKSQGGEMQ